MQRKRLLFVVGVLIVVVVGSYAAVSWPGCDEPPGFVEARWVAEPPADATVVAANETSLSESSPVMEALANASNSSAEFVRVGVSSQEACAYEETMSNLSRYTPEGESRITEVGYYIRYEGEIYQVVRFEEY